MILRKQGVVWVADSSFDERHIPKSAGFWWHGGNCRSGCKACASGVGKVWWTPYKEKAAKLNQFADESCADLRGFSEERKAKIEASRATDANIEVPAPQGLAYLPFQRGGIARLWEQKSGLLADEQGLGKTIQVIGIFNLRPDVENVLIICPNSVKLNWRREFLKWSTIPVEVGVASGKIWPTFTSGGATVTITNFDILHNFEAQLRQHQWDLVVVDECHYLVDPKSRRSRHVYGHKSNQKAYNTAVKKVHEKNRRGELKKPLDVELARLAEKHREIQPIPTRMSLFLTGTPLVNRPLDLWPIIHYLDPENWPNFFSFARRYCDAKQIEIGWGRTAWDFKGASNLDELQEKLRATIMVRRMKADVMKELPPKFRQLIEIPCNGAKKLVDAENAAYEAHRENIETLRERVAAARENKDNAEYKEAVAALKEGLTAAFTDTSRIRHEVAIAKIPHLIEHVGDALETRGKIIFFAHHKEVIATMMKEFGDRAVKIDGSVPIEERQAAIDRFQSDPKCNLFVGSIRACAEGITLTAASHVIFGELDWTPGKMNQAEDRAHRIGQINNVLIQHLVFEGSLDARMVDILVGKQDIIDDALNTKHQEYEVPTLPKPPAPKPEPEVSVEEMAAIHRGLKILAGLSPDGVSLRNDQGFNATDLGFGRQLAYRSALTPRQAVAARKLLRKYHRQLGNELIAKMGAKPIEQKE